MRLINASLAALSAAGLAFGLVTSALAGDMAYSGKLLLTQGVSTIEGSAGGGLATWAVITGYETRDGIGANVHASYVDVSDYSLRDVGGSVGFWDRIELSYAREAFDTGSTGAKLGLGRDFTFDQDVVGAKLRLFGDAVYDQDSWLPQVSVGTQFKAADRHAVLKAIGAASPDGCGTGRRVQRNSLGRFAPGCASMLHPGLPSRRIAEQCPRLAFTSGR